MAKTPGQPKRGKGGRFVAGQEPAPEGQEDEELSEENDWSRGEGFGSIGPAAFGTPSQQASLRADQSTWAAWFAWDILDTMVRAGGAS